MTKVLPLKRADGWDVHFNATRIELVCDGNGPMGLYDVIYVYNYGGGILNVMPAHHVQTWCPLYVSENMALKEKKHETGEHSNPGG